MSLFQYLLRPLIVYGSFISALACSLLNKYYSQTIRKQLIKAWTLTSLPSSNGNIQMDISMIIVLLLIHIGWMSFAFGIIVMIMVKACTNAYLQVVIYNNEFLINYRFQQLKQHVSNGLECIKFIKMIKKGYQLKSNTNIILEEENASVQNSQIYQFNSTSQSDINLQRGIINVYQILLGIRLVTQSIWQSDQNTTIPFRKYQIPLSFKDIFEINKQCCTYFDIVKKIHLRLKVKHLDPNQSPFHLYLINKQVKKIIEKLVRLEEVIQTARSLVNRCKDIQTNQQQYRQLLSYFTSENQQNHEKVLQIYSQLELSIKQKDKDSEVKEEERINSSQQNLQNQIYSVDFKQKDNQFVAPFHEKKQFMKKLDILLSIGMLRRQQQRMNSKNYESQLQIFEQQQATLPQTVS